MEIEKNLKKYAELLVELGGLKLTPRSGWFKIGIRNPESVAEHSFRVAVISYIIAKLEGLGNLAACMIAFLALLHDSHEVRTTDLHKVAKKYVTVNEEIIKKEQLSVLKVENILGELKSMGINENTIKDYIKDADLLELSIQAREYSNITPLAKSFEIEESNLKTKSGKALLRALKEVELDWWNKI